MRAQVLAALTSLDENASPLRAVDLPMPEPREEEIAIRVSYCGICHTELDEIEGRMPPPVLPMILGHQVVGTVAGSGRRAGRFKIGARVGVGWIYSSCGRCPFCLNGEENLCSEFKATGRDAAGGYAEYMAVREDFAYPIPDTLADAEAAPLLCAGAIGYRSIRLAGIRNGQNLGLTGFGASAHLVLKTVKHLYPHTAVFVFARSEEERAFARELGACWAGAAEEQSPEKLRAIIDTTPVWKPVVASLVNLEPGGRLVINAIRKEEFDKSALLAVNYARDLWMEKEIKSVANVTRQDVTEFIELASAIPIKPEIQVYPLDQANKALKELKDRKIRGAKVLRISS